jgi:hypothetical protein
MRVLSAIAIALLGIAGIMPARAADLRVSPQYRSSWFVGERAGPIVIFDDEPGVVVRPYWLPPWRNRHYFPMAGRRPRLGRHENLAAHTAYRPAQDFYRQWSTRAFMPESLLTTCTRSLGRPYCAAPRFN